MLQSPMVLKALSLQLSMEIKVLHSQDASLEGEGS